MHTIHSGPAMFGLAHHGERYERIVTRVAARLYRRVTADVVAAALPPGARILDVGTGPGLLPLGVGTTCPQLRIDAIDVSPQMIDRARQGATSTGRADGVTFTVADVARLPFADATFDLVVSTLSQHHWTDPGAGFQELNRVLRPNAQAWIYDVRWALRRAQAAATHHLTAARHQPTEPPGRHLPPQPDRATRPAHGSPIPAE